MNNTALPTYAERVDLHNLQYDDICTISNVKDELYSLLDEMKIDKDGMHYYPDPDRVNRAIWLCADALHNVLNDWYAVLGDTGYLSESYQVERARMLLERNKLSHLVSRLYDKIIEASTQEVEDSLKAIRKKAINLPDAEAIELIENAIGSI